jgi:RNA polymerase sigma-70 factor (ECF subfamily)
MGVDADPYPDRRAPAAGPSGPDRSKLFLRLFLRNERRIYAYVLTLLAHRADADDVLQEVSLTMWDKFDVGRPPDDFAAWGCRIAYFKVLDFYKKRGRERARFGPALLERLAETAADPTGDLRLDARREALAQCLEKLTPRDRDLLARRFADGATTRSASAELGRSTEAVYKALAKIRRALFECVQTTLAREGRP